MSLDVVVMVVGYRSRAFADIVGRSLAADCVPVPLDAVAAAMVVDYHSQAFVGIVDRSLAVDCARALVGCKAVVDIAFAVVLLVLAPRLQEHIA